jgi:uncharacterized protein with ATP-grasp and redox domains
MTANGYHLKKRQACIICLLTEVQNMIYEVVKKQTRLGSILQTGECVKQYYRDEISKIQTIESLKTASIKLN